MSVAKDIVKAKANDAKANLEKEDLKHNDTGQCNLTKRNILIDI